MSDPELGLPDTNSVLSDAKFGPQDPTQDSQTNSGLSDAKLGPQDPTQDSQTFSLFFFISHIGYNAILPLNKKKLLVSWNLLEWDLATLPFLMLSIA